MEKQLEFPDFMGGMDAMMWAIEDEPVLRSTSCGVLVLDASPDPEVLRSQVRGMIAAIPRLRQRVVSSRFSTAPPHFEPADVDLRHHLAWIGCPGEGSQADLMDVAAWLRTKDFDRQRPLWEFVVVTGLEAGRAALIVKVHHAVTDAVGGMELIFQPLMHHDRERSMRVPDVAALTEEHGRDGPWRHEARAAAATTASLGRGAVSLLRDPVGSVQSGTNSLRSLVRVMGPAGRPLSPVMTERSLRVRYDVQRVDFDRLKAACRSAGVKLNDGFVAGVIRGLRHYHAKHGTQPDTLRMLMPVNMRDGSATEAGNDFAAARFEVALNIENPEELMQDVASRSAAAQQEPGLRLYDAVASVAGRLPPAAIIPAYRQLAQGIDFVTSNVPGPSVRLHLAGARVDSFHAFGPIAGAALNVTLLSYAGGLELAIQTDRAAVTDPETLLDCFRLGFGEVSDVAPAATKARAGETSS